MNLFQGHASTSARPRAIRVSVRVRVRVRVRPGLGLGLRGSLHFSVRIYTNDVEVTSGVIVALQTWHGRTPNREFVMMLKLHQGL